MFIALSSLTLLVGSVGVFAANRNIAPFSAIADHTPSGQGRLLTPEAQHYIRNRERAMLMRGLGPEQVKQQLMVIEESFMQAEASRTAHAQP